jgi:hypothetical protein
MDEWFTYSELEKALMQLTWALKSEQWAEWYRAIGDPEAAGQSTMMAINFREQAEDYYKEHAYDACASA